MTEVLLRLDGFNVSMATPKLNTAMLFIDMSNK